MSKYMLSDEDSINKINPYVQRTFSLPGAVGTPHPFEEFKEPVEIDTCRPSKTECRLSRPLIPGRNIDMGVRESEIYGIETVIQGMKNVVKGMKTLDLFTIALIVLIILVLSSARR